MRKCIHTEVTNQIIEQIETGSALPWWIREGETVSFCSNAPASPGLMRWNIK